MLCCADPCCTQERWAGCAVLRYPGPQLLLCSALWARHVHPSTSSSLPSSHAPWLLHNPHGAHNVIVDVTGQQIWGRRGAKSEDGAYPLVAQPRGLGALILLAGDTTIQLTNPAPSAHCAALGCPSPARVSFPLLLHNVLGLQVAPPAWFRQHCNTATVLLPAGMGLSASSGEESLTIAMHATEVPG